MFGLKKFFGNTSGGATVPFSISLMAISMAAGVAIDYGRLNDIQTRAHMIADSAALAGVSVESTSQADMEKAANAFLKKNTDELGLDDVQPATFKYDPSTAEFTVTVKGKVKTSIVSIAGVNEMEYSVNSTAVRSSVPPIEMVLALDTTGSMAGTKIDSLKTAASNMVKSVLKNKDAKVGIVPFSQYVNVGVSRRNIPYLNVPADYSQNAQSCSTTYPNKKGCKTVKTNTTCTSNNDGIVTTYPCTTSKEVCDSWGTSVQTCKTVTNNYTFRGCIGSRAEARRARIDDETSKYPGFLNVNCGTEIQDMTDILGHLQSKIVQLSATGQTYLPAGLTWGWNMLNANQPLNAALDPAKLKEKGGKKVLVFMTDGANTLVPQNQNAGTHIQPTNSTYYKNVNYANTLTSDLCVAIKQDGIEIYTVLFDVTDPALEKLLKDCATSATMSYTASNSTQLVEAFEKIVKDLAQIRIAK